MHDDPVWLSLNCTLYLLIPFNKSYLLWMIEKKYLLKKNKLKLNMSKEKFLTLFIIVLYDKFYEYYKFFKLSKI